MLLLTLLIPLIGAIITPFLNGKAVKYSSAFFSIITFAVSLLFYSGFNPSDLKFQFVTSYPWINSLDINFKFGIDGMSLLLVLLTTLIFPIAIISSWESIKEKILLLPIIIIIRVWSYRRFYIT